MVIADLCSCAELFAGSHAGDGEKIHIAHIYDSAEQSRLVGEYNLICAGPDLFDIDGPSQGYSQALALSDRVMCDALVCAQHISCLIHKIPGTGYMKERSGGGATRAFSGAGKGLRVLFICVILDEIGVMAVRHKTDFLGIGLVSHGKIGFLRNPAHFFFGIFSQGHEGSCKLLLCELIEHVGLVFGCIVGFFDGISAVFQLQDMGIVARGYIVRPHDFCGVEHSLPLQISVALDAGIGGLASQITLHKGVNDFLGKLCKAVEWIKADSQCVGDSARVINLTAPALTSVVGSPGAQGHPAHFIAFLLQQISCHGTVHTSGHAD